LAGPGPGVVEGTPDRDRRSGFYALLNLPRYRPFFLRRLGEVVGVNLEAEHFTAEAHVERYADLARRVVVRAPDVIVSLTGDLVRT